MKAKKSLGQHFLTCPWVADTLISAAEVSREDTVLEIGPGTGVLTRAIASRAKKVIAVEKDERMAAELDASLKKEGITNVQIITADILKIFHQLPTTYNLPPTSYKIIANIPYYLTGRLLRIVLESPHKPERIALTIQKEVAQRIVAKPPRMNLLALSVHAFGTPTIIKAVPASCFSPKPKVDSAVIAIADLSDNFFLQNKISKELFFKIIRAAFNQKRKTLANSLASVIGDKNKALTLIRATGLGDAARPEELSLPVWAGICRIFIARTHRALARRITS